MRFIALSSFCATLLACGATTTLSPDGGTLTGSCGGQTGVTDCRGVSCQAGNYCSNNYYVSDYCQPGCTSDSNCGSGDFCARCPGESLGVCQRCGTSANCGQGSHCKASNTASTICTQASQGSQGYDCSDSDRPVGSCEQSKSVPTIYCCGTVTSSCTATPSSNMCDNAWVQFQGKPGDYSHTYSCSGTATPAGTCKHLLADTWCCN